MSVICAVTDDVSTWIGCDGLQVTGSYIDGRDRRKWVVGSAWSIGFVGSDKLITLANGEEAFRSLLDTDAAAWTIAKALRDVVETDGWNLRSADDDEGYPKGYNLTAILARPGHIYEIEGNFNVTDVGPAWAAGTGDVVARAVLDHLLVDEGLTDPERAVRCAVGAAARLSTTCGGSLWFHKLEAA